MTARNQDYARLVRTLTPALKQHASVPKRHSAAQKRDLTLARRWTADRNVVGFGVGPKCVDNTPNYGRQSLVVFVVKKLAKSRIPRQQLVPRRLQAESIERTVTTDVIEVGTLPMLQATLCPGTDAAHFTMRDGSVTAIVRARNAPPLPFLLSCCHVFAPPGAMGRQVESPPDPSSITFRNHVANVAMFEPLRAGGNVANRMDAALAAPLSPGPSLSNDIPGLGPITSVSPLRSGEFLRRGIRRVLGVGAMTPRVQGEILAENVATMLADPVGRAFLFQDLVAYRPTPVTQPGDSGMPILLRTAAGIQLLGMHIGIGRVGSSQAGAAFFVPIAPVLDRFAVDLAV